MSQNELMESLLGRIGERNWATCEEETGGSPFEVREASDWVRSSNLSTRYEDFIRAVLSPGKYSHDELQNYHYLRHKLATGAPLVRRYISVDLDVMHGNPVFSGTRLPLYRVIEEMAGGTSLEELVEDYPVLSPKALEAGLDFVRSLLRVFDD